MSSRRALEALACGCAAHAVQMLALTVATVGPVSAPFFFTHLALVVLFYAALALGVSGLGLERDRAGLAATWPLAAAAFAFFGPPGTGTIAAAGVAALVVGSARRVPSLDPLTATVLGAALGATTRFFRVEHYAGRQTALGAVALGLLLIAASIVLAGLLRLCVARLGLTATAAAMVLIAPALAYGGIVDRYVPRTSAPAAAAAGSPPVVLVILDTVRAGHLRAYGYERDPMPELERFAGKHMVRVERSVANSSWTIPTHASMFTGLVPIRHGAGMGPLPATPSESRGLRSDNVTLAELLAARGYSTAAVSANHAAVKKEFGLGRGFGSFRSEPDRDSRAKALTPWTLASKDRAPLARLDALWPFALSEFFEVGVPYRRARAITDEALSFVDRAGERPFFLFVNYMDAHWPYRAPHPGRRRYAGGRGAPPEGWTTRAFREVLEGGRDLAPAERQELVDLYDAQLTYLDGQLARLLRGLAAHPRWADMVVVVTSDHGEAFGEHRLIHHSRALYEELLATPLFVKTGRSAPPAAGPWPGPLQSVDIFATLLELAGVPAPAGIDGLAWGQGRTTTRAWVDPDETARPNPTRFNRSLRSIERSGFKLIESSLGSVELYDLRHDPHETVNLAEREPALAKELREALGPWTSEASSTRELQQERAEELRALGYVQ